MQGEQLLAITRLREQLAGGDPDLQVSAAAQLADVLAAGALGQDDAEAVFGDLVHAAVHAHLYTVAEQMLHALQEGLQHYRPPLRLVRALADPALIRHTDPDAVLNIIAGTHDRAAHDMITPYLRDPRKQVRTAARAALEELPGRVGHVQPLPDRYVTPAYADRWAHDVTAQVAILAATFEARQGYPIGNNVLGGPSTQRELVDLVAGSLRAAMPSDLFVWYRRIREVNLPDVANGVFIHPADVVCAHAAGDGVHAVTGRHDDHVVVFGSNGGGTLYAARAGSANAIYRLPPGHVTDGLYTSEDPRFAVVAWSLVDFMDLLRDAVRSFTRDGSIVDL